MIYSPDRNHGTFLPVHTMSVALLEKVCKRYQLNLFQYWRDQKKFEIRGLSNLYINSGHLEIINKQREQNGNVTTMLQAV